MPQPAVSGATPSQPGHLAGAASPGLVAPLSSFIGREREIESIVDLLRQDNVRLVTLTGPGGVGKTRLALQVAARIAPFFTDGVTTVSLAAVSDHALVPGAIAEAVSVRSAPGRPVSEVVAEYLAGKHALLLLDNFEHVVEAGRDIAALLAVCPHLKVLITSRAVLHLAGEHDVTIGPLQLPVERDARSSRAVAQSPSVRLFVERARSASSTFALTDDNAGTVAEICRRVDGLPLAIELAAARVPHLPARALLDRLEHRMPLLTGGARDQPARQQTMRNTIAWSYDLLTPEEQALFRQVAVFVGGFTLEAAEAIGGPEVLDGVSSLADKSLIRLDGRGRPEPRYLMLETLREFGQELLADNREEDAARAAHAAYFLEYAELLSHRDSSPTMPETLAALGVEQGNMRAALSWFAAQGDGAALLRLASAHGYYWEYTGPWTEGNAWLERGLAADARPTPERVEALLSRGASAGYQGDYDRAEIWLREGIDLARQLGAHALAADALTYLASQKVDQGQYEAGEALLDEALVHARQARDPVCDAQILVHRGICLWARGKTREAVEHLEAGRALALQHDEGIMTAAPSRYLGHIATAAGDLAIASEQFRMFWRFNVTSDHLLSRLLPDLMPLAVACGLPEQAAQLYGAGETVIRITHLAPAWPERGVHEEAVAQARATLGERAFEAATAAGRALPFDEALTLIETVLTAAESSQATDAAGGTDMGAQSLTQREREVLALLVEGRTNVEIGEQLFISHRTAQTHVTNILGKLGVTTRTEAAARAVRDGLI